MATVFIDVREPGEYKMNHVNAALNIPVGKLSANNKTLQAVSKDDEVVVYCASGNRANGALATLKSLGYLHVKNGINTQTVRATYGV